MSTQEVTAEETAVEPEIQSTDAKSETEPLGEAGIAALKSEREARKAAEKSATELAARIKEFEDRDKSETERQSERLAEFERENAELKSAKTRAEVAAAKGVPVELLTGSTQEELEASADALNKFKGEKQTQRLHIPNEGNSPTNTSNPSDDFAEFLNSQLGQQPA